MTKAGLKEYNITNRAWRKKINLGSQMTGQASDKGVTTTRPKLPRLASIKQFSIIYFYFVPYINITFTQKKLTSICRLYTFVFVNCITNTK